MLLGTCGQCSHTLQWHGSPEPREEDVNGLKPHENRGRDALTPLFGHAVHSRTCVVVGQLVVEVHRDSRNDCGLLVNYEGRARLRAEIQPCRTAKGRNKQSGCTDGWHSARCERITTVVCTECSGGVHRETAERPCSPSMALFFILH